MPPIADPEIEESPVEVPVDTEMADTTEAGAEGAEENPSAELPYAEENPSEEEQPARATFISYLQSPIVSLLVGDGSESTLTAHQGLLVKSPFFKDACAEFDEATVVCFPRFVLSLRTRARMTPPTIASNPPLRA